MKRSVWVTCLVLSVVYAKNISNNFYYGLGVGSGFNNSNLISNGLENGNIPTSVYANVALFNTFSILVKYRTSAQLLATTGYVFETSPGGYKAAVQLDAALNTIENALYQPTPTNIVDMQTLYDYGASIRLFRNSAATFDPFLIAGLRTTVVETNFSKYTDFVRTDSYYRKPITAPEIGIGLQYARNDMVDMRLEYKYFFGGKTQAIDSSWPYFNNDEFFVIEDKVLIKQHSLQFVVVY